MALKLFDFTIKQSQKILVARRENDTREFVSSIEDIRLTGITITIPLHNQVSMGLIKGERVYVKVIMENFTAEFHSRVKSFKSDNITMVILELPREYKRVQRRGMVRLRLLMDVQLAKMPEDKEEPVYTDATALDLSAGGMEIITTTLYEKGSSVLVRFDLKMSDTVVHEFCVKSVVRRKMLVNKKFKIGVEFTELNRVETDRIFQYIFKKQTQKGF